MTDHYPNKICTPGAHVRVAVGDPDDDDDVDDSAIGIEFGAVAPPESTNGTHYDIFPPLEELRRLVTYPDSDTVEDYALVGGQSWTLKHDLYERRECGRWEYAYTTDDTLRVEQCTGCGDYRTNGPANFHDADVNSD